MSVGDDCVECVLVLCVCESEGVSAGVSECGSYCEVY